ncbi:hypothetical protein PUN28_018125 [Cardiocondyla obscurior]|uniref:Odorant receptor n=1 Tax=Cardiocondyla obscurior TaxID=286306 RepID=A0AAW2EJR9_9HYME
MQFFDGRNYRINKVLLSCVGQWPYQTNRSSNAIIIIIVSLAGTQIIAKICGLLSIHNFDLFIDSLSPLVVDLGCAIKLVTCVLRATEIRELFDQIQYDWQLLITSPYIKTLSNYAQGGRTFTLIYAGSFYSALTFFMLVPLQQLLLDSSLNASTRPLLHQVEYYIDMEKYYFPILIHGYLTAIICVSISVAADTMYVIVVQHICGLFMIIGQQLDNLIKTDNLEIDLNPPIKDDKPYENVVNSIRTHKKALRRYGTSALFAVTNMDKPEEFFRQITFSCALLVHLFFESFQAQRLIDHSSLVHTSLTSVPWYQTSSRTRKILIFMIMKTREPCVLTAGKMYVISMDTFSTIVRTSVSYFTMLRSVYN